MRSWKKLLAIAVVTLVVVSACSGEAGSETFGEIGSSLDSGGADSDEGATAPAAASAGESQEETAADDNRELGSGAIAPVALPIDLGRDIIFVADLSVAVTDVVAAGEEANRHIQAVGGYLFGQQTSGGPNPSSILTFKVTPERFQDALARLASIGEVRHQSVSASDVTERIVDLESRIATSTASVDRLRGLLAEATDIKAVVELESELLTRETDLETLRGSLRTLEDQVALATIALSLTEAASRPAFAVTISAYSAHDGGLSCPGTESLDLETSTAATVCYEIANTGDTWLAEFEMRDPVLDIELDDLIAVFGDPQESLEPGDSLILAAEVVPDRALRTQTTFTATAVDESGESLSARPISQTETLFVNTVDPEGIASFGDGLSASWDLLVRGVQLAVLALGALLPFAWVPIVAWLVLKYLRRPTVES